MFVRVVLRFVVRFVLPRRVPHLVSVPADRLSADWQRLFLSERLFLLAIALYALLPTRDGRFDERFVSFRFSPFRKPSVSGSPLRFWTFCRSRFGGPVALYVSLARFAVPAS